MISTKNKVFIGKLSVVHNDVDAVRGIYRDSYREISGGIPREIQVCQRLYLSHRKCCTVQVDESYVYETSVMDSNTDAVTRMLRALTIEDIQEAQEIEASPEANADPHFLLLGRTKVGKSTFAGKITRGGIQGSSRPTRGTEISDSPGEKYIKTELMVDPNTEQRYYVHDTVGLGDTEVNVEEMKREVNELCEQNDSCCVFLCLSCCDDSITSHVTETLFEVCNSLHKWEDVIFVITKCDSASQPASNVDNTFDFKSEWKKAIRDKLIQDMRVDEEVANNIATKQIVFSGHSQSCSAEILDALQNIIKVGLERGSRMKYLSLGKALFSMKTMLEARELQRQHSESDQNTAPVENIVPVQNIVPVENVTEAEDSGIRRRRHGEHSQHSNTSPFSPPSPTSYMESSSYSSRISCLSPSYQHAHRSPPPPYDAEPPAYDAEPPPYDAEPRAEPLPYPNSPESSQPSADTVVKTITAAVVVGLGSGIGIGLFASSIFVGIGGGIFIGVGTFAILYLGSKLLCD